MIQGEDFLYLLHNENMEFYYTDNYGNVFTSTTPKVLKFSPDGWQEVSIMTELNKKYWGFDRTFTIPLAFVEDGAAIIKQIMYRDGYEAKLFMTILQQKLRINLGKYSFYYDLLYRGEIDLSTFVHKGAKVTVNAVDGGLAALIKANENTVYEIPVDAPDTVNVMMDGIPLHETANMTVPDGLEIAKSLYGTNFLMPLVLLTREGQSTGISFNSVQIQNVTPLTFEQKIALDDSFIDSSAANAGPVFINIKGKLSFYCSVNNPGLGFRVRLLKSTMNISQQSAFIWFTSVPVAGQTCSFDIDLDYAILPNERFFLEGIFFGGTTGAVDIKIDFDPNSDLAITYKNTFKTTYIKGRKPFSVFGELIKRITDGKYFPAGQILQELDVVHTCGDAIRGIEGAKIKTSLSQFYNSYNARFNLGMGIFAGQLLLERKEFWLDGTEIELGQVSELEMSVAEDLAFSALKFGYEKQDTDTVNGKQEFNTTMVLAPPSVRVTRDFDQISDYRTDATGIEEIRINLQGKKTTDDSADNDNILLHITKQPVSYFTTTNVPIYGLNRTLNVGASGLIEVGKMFNIEFSPKRMFNAWGWYLHSVLPPITDPKYIKFASIDKNADLVAGGVVEKADVLVGELPARKFLPYYFSFETRLPENYLELITQSPVRVYKFSYKGLSLRGVAVESGIEPSSRKSQVFKLLSLADNDMIKLRKIYE